MSKMGADHFQLEELEYHSCSDHMYLSEPIRTMFLYHVGTGNTQFFALVAGKKVFLYVLAPSRQNLMPNVQRLYRKIYEENMEDMPDQSDIPEEISVEEVKVEINMKEIQKSFTKAFNQEKKGPVMFCYQSAGDSCPIKVDDCPLVALPKLPRNELQGMSLKVKTTICLEIKKT